MASKGTYTVRDSKTGQVIRTSNFGDKISDAQLQDRAQTVKKNIAPQTISSSQAKAQVGQAEVLQSQQAQAQAIKTQEVQQQKSNEVISKIYNNPNRKDITNETLKKQGFNMQQIAEIGRIQEREQRQRVYEDELAKKNLNFDKYNKQINSKSPYQGQERDTSESNTRIEAQRTQLKTDLRNIENNKNLNYLQKEEAKHNVIGVTAGSPKKQGLFNTENTQKDFQFTNEVLTTPEQRLLQKAVRKESMTPTEIKDLNQVYINKNKELLDLQKKGLINLPKNALNTIKGTPKFTKEVIKGISSVTSEPLARLTQYATEGSIKGVANSIGYFTKRQDILIRQAKGIDGKKYTKPGESIENTLNNDWKKVYNKASKIGTTAWKGYKSSISISKRGLEFIGSHPKETAIILATFSSVYGLKYVNAFKDNPGRTLGQTLGFLIPEKKIIDAGDLAKLKSGELLTKIKNTETYLTNEKKVLETTSSLKSKVKEIALQSKYSAKIINSWSKTELTRFLNKFSRFETRTIKGKQVLVEKVKGKLLTKSELKQAQAIFNKKEVPKTETTKSSKQQVKGLLTNRQLLEDKRILLEKENIFKFPKKEIYTEEELKQAVLNFKNNPKELGKLREIARKQNLSFKIKTKKGKTKIIFKESINKKKGIETKRQKSYNFQIENGQISKKKQFKLEEKQELTNKELKKQQKLKEFEEGQNLDKIQNDIRNFEKKKGFFGDKKGSLTFFKGFKKQLPKLKKDSTKKFKIINQKKQQVTNYQKNLNNMKKQFKNIKFDKNLNNRQKIQRKREIKQKEKQIKIISREIKQETKVLNKQRLLIKSIISLSSKIKIPNQTNSLKILSNKQKYKLNNLNLKSYKYKQSTKTQQKQAQQQKQKQAQQQKQKQAQQQKQKQKNKFAVPNKPTPKEINKPKKANNQTQKRFEKQKPFKPLREPKYKPKFKPKVPPKKPFEPPKPKLFPNKKKNKSKLVPMGKYVYKDTKTKKLITIKTKLPYNKAKNLARKGTDNTIQAKVKTLPYGKTKLKDIKPNSNKKFILNRKGEEVEKNKFRLDTQGEKRGIQFGKYIKSQLKPKSTLKRTIKRSSRVIKHKTIKKVIYKPVKRVIIKRSKKR